MSHLLYKTRGNVNPQGKSRVYFAAHPSDMERYLDDVAEVLLSIESCAVWYDPTPSCEEGLEEHLSSLEEMKLFVIPVTYVFLSSPSRARDVELPWALEHHIPVLPLMQEAGLDGLFSEVCGELQYLDRTSRDETAISFEKKLTDYLRAVLVGEELAREIRASFDGYIFLSYRKKDRRQAQELMRLIHRDERCQNVAIWYDEYLTPGESFRENIELALQKSHLFVLAVTPNLVCEPNYVQAVEYPLAKKLGKPILSALLEPTSEALLQEQYSDLPALTDPHDGQALSRDLASVLGGAIAQEKAADPRHAYLMGLAYLGGVDVEVDHARALSLLTGAAERGCADATKKLSSMYQLGEGVARDAAKAVAWQEKTVQLSRVAYRAAPSVDGAVDYLNEYSLLCNQYLRLTRELDRAEACFLDLLRECEEADELYREGFSQAIASYAYDKLGILYHEKGNLPEAAKWFERGLALRQSDCVNRDTPVIQEDLSRSYGLIGRIYMESGDHEAALDAMERAVAHAKKLCELEDSVDAQRTLAAAYHSLAQVYRALGNRADAYVHFTRSLSLSRELSLETCAPEDRLSVSTDLMNLAELAYLGGGYTDAEELQRDALTTCRAVCEETGTPNARRCLMTSCLELSKTLCRLDRADEAEPLVREGVALAESLLEECPTHDARNCVSVAWRILAEVLQAQGKGEEAEVLLRRANAEDEALADAVTDVTSYRRSQMTSTLSLAISAVKQGHPDEAEELFLKTLSLAEDLYAAHPTDASLGDLLTVLDNVTLFYRHRGQDRQATSSMQRSIDLRQEHLGDAPSCEEVMGLAKRMNELGNLYESLDLYEEALPCHDRALALRLDHIDRLGHTPDNLNEVATGYEFLGCLLCSFEGGAEEAQGLLDAALSVRRSLFESYATTKNREYLAFSLFFRGQAEEAPLGRPYYEESLSILRALEADHPENESYGAMCEAVARHL